ncbi:MAG: DUF2855 family protein [Pseudomonadota bacterium]
MGRALEIDRADITRASLSERADTVLEDGEVRLTIENFALTANNVTYAATGEALGYWKFFPAADPTLGRLPVWGIATVSESRSEIAVGERVFGCVPMADALTVTPGRIRPMAWTDVASHRTELPPVYNEYFRLGAIPGHDPALEDRMGLLYPLYATSYVLADFLADNDWFGAEQIVIGSASSKTAIGFMEMAGDLNAPSQIGLTSLRNVSFVEGLDCCAEVIPYANVNQLAERPSVYVDMSGNTEVRMAVHTRLQAHLTYSCAVGLSHWDKFEQGVKVPGPEPEFFFAPAQIKKRRAEWGPGVIEGKVMEAWRRHAKTSERWLELKRHHGLDEATRIYKDLAAGNVSPRDGHIVLLG